MPDARLSMHVVVVTRDRRDELLGVLARLCGLPEAPPVVVVDNGSTDGTAAAARRRYPGIRVLRLSDNRGAAARNVGAAAIRSDLVAFADDDSWWAPGSLERAARIFRRHDRLGVLAARILVGPEERPDPVTEAMAESPLWTPPPGPGRRVMGFIACGAVVRRSAFLGVGGFHPRLRLGGEEGLLALDLAARGWELRYVPEVVAHHHPSANRDAPARRRVQVRNDIWTAWLRRPVTSALRATVQMTATALTDPAGRRGLGDAAAGWRWVRRERRVIPREVERELRVLGR